MLDRETQIFHLPNNHQDERVQGRIMEQVAIPQALRQLQASSFVKLRDRAICTPTLPNFRRIAHAGADATSEQSALTKLRAGILLVEAALPLGSIETSDEGSWSPEFAKCWRAKVTDADSVRTLTGCLILLENAISTDWLRPNAEHLLSCLPRPWKAVNEASVSSIFLRLCVLDGGIKYGLINDDGEWTSIDKVKDPYEEWQSRRKALDP